MKESLIDALLNIQPGKDILIGYGDIPEGAERITLPSGMGGTVIERRGDLLAVGIHAGAAVATVLYVQKDSQMIRIRPIPHQKMQTRTGEIVNAPEYNRWVERIKNEAPEYLPEWEKASAKQIDVQAIFNKYTSGYSRLSLVAVTQLSDIKLAEDLISAIPELSKDDALNIAPQVRALANAKAKEMETQEVKAAPSEVPKVDFWGMVKDLKITDVEVFLYPAGKEPYTVKHLVVAHLENGKMVKLDEHIYKGQDARQAEKLGPDYFKKEELEYLGKPLSERTSERTFDSLNRYEEYVKQKPAPVQKRFEETGPIAGGTPARQILTVTEPEEYYFGTEIEVMQGADPGLEPYFTGTVKRLLNKGELVEVHPEGDPREVSFRVPVDRVNVTRLVTQEGVASKKLYRYYYRNRPPSVGTQPEGFINHESWLPARTAPHGRTAFGWVEYDRPLTPQEISGYELFEDEVEIPKLVRELVEFARVEGIDEAMKELTSEYGRAVWDWLKSQKRLTTRGQKEQIRDEIMRLAGITAAPTATQPSPSVQARFNAYIASTVLTTGSIASPKFLSDEKMAQDIERNIQVSIDEARQLVPQFRAIAEKKINKEEIESIKELFGIDVEQEAHNLGIDLADYAIIKAGNKVVLQHKTIVQRRYEIKEPEKHREESDRKMKALTAQKEAEKLGAKPMQSIQDVKQHTLSSIQAAGTVEELQSILKGIGFLPLAGPEKQQVMDAYQNKFSTLMSERPFGAPVQAEKKAAVATPQQLFEAEQRRKAMEARRVSVTPTLTGGAVTAKRLEMFEPGAMEKAKAEAEAKRRIEQLGLPYEVHPYIKKLASGTQDVMKFGTKRGKETVEDLVLSRYVRFCPPGTIIDNRSIPKVPERWWVYPPKLRACMGEIEKKVAQAGAVQECMVRENIQHAMTESMRSYIQGAQAVRDVIHYFRDNRPPIRGVLYRARDRTYFVEAQDGQVYASMGWDDVSQAMKPGMAMA